MRHLSPTVPSPTADGGDTLCLCALTAAGGAARAANTVWKGASTSWSAGTNWTGGIPTSSLIVEFSGTVANPTATVDAAGQAASLIQFDSGAGNILVGFTSATGGSLGSGTHDLMSFATPEPASLALLMLAGLPAAGEAAAARRRSCLRRRRFTVGMDAVKD